MIRTYKYLLRPNLEQSNQLDFLLCQSRLIYNAALEQRIRNFRETGQGLGYGAQWAYFRDLRHDHPTTFGMLNASSLQHLLRRLDKAFAAYFRRLKMGEKPGFPRFKGHGSFKSLEYTYGDGCKLRKDEQGRWRFYIQNVGVMRMCYHRSLPEEAHLKHAIVKLINEHWYVCLMFELPVPIKKHASTGKQVGIDLGLKILVALSTGELISNPYWLRSNLAKLRCLQRHASRQVQGSHRQYKSYHRMARLHEQVANRRRDYLHKISYRLVAENDLIAIENLTLGFINHNRHLALASHDAGFGLFRHMLEYKAESAGIQLVAVNPSNTTQICSGCGSMVIKGLSVRLHTCPECGLILDRDVNAARNILDMALKNLLGRSGQALTWPVGASVA